jgi:pimeloyl-ACP methyl ester carboxylesterase
MKAAYGDNFFYILYFQEPGKAEAELSAEVRRTMRMFLYSASGEPERPAGARTLHRSAKFLDMMIDPGEGWNTWCTPEDLDFYTKEFERATFRGGLNWYRNVDRTWEFMAPFNGAKMTQPAFFIAGERDGVIAMNPAALQNLKNSVPNLKGQALFPGCGHWTQQERPNETNAAMIGFLKTLQFGGGEPTTDGSGTMPPVPRS